MVPEKVCNADKRIIPVSQTAVPDTSYWRDPMALPLELTHDTYVAVEGQWLIVTEQGSAVFTPTVVIGTTVLGIWSDPGNGVETIAVRVLKPAKEA